jgi:hypothetical protein
VVEGKNLESKKELGELGKVLFAHRNFVVGEQFLDQPAKKITVFLLTKKSYH